MITLGLVLRHLVFGFVLHRVGDDFSKPLFKDFFAFEKMGTSKKFRKKMFVTCLKGRNKGSLASLEVASRGS